MGAKNATMPAANITQKDEAQLLRQYGCGPITFVGNDGLYDRHLLFENVVDEDDVDSRERFEASARSTRDILSQRWILTEKTYERKNPKRIYYLSMEFLLDRSLSNNITNLLLSPIATQMAREKKIDYFSLLEQEPDAGLGNGGLGRLAACFLDSMATMQLPTMGYGLRYEYGIFKQVIKDGWQLEKPDNWLRNADPWEVARPHERVEIKLACSFEMHDGVLTVVPGKPSTLYGIPLIALLWATEGRRSILYGCGQLVAQITSIFRGSAVVISLVLSLKRSPQNHLREYSILTIAPVWAEACALCSNTF